MEQKKFTKISILFILIICISIMLNQNALANSAEPPAFTVVVSNPPKDLELSIRFNDGNIESFNLIKKRAWEVYYQFYYHGSPDVRNFEDAVLVVKYGEKTFECKLFENELNKYNSIFTLNIENQSIKEGWSLSRLILLIALRVILTLIIEGLIFYAFGYREKRSWIIFLIINLITQTALNIALSGSYPSAYLFVGLIFCEILIVIVETIAFAFALHEQSKLKAVIYVFAANIASLILGGILLSYLPI